MPTNYTDTALDDFLTRFGDDDPNKQMVQNRPKVNPISAQKADLGLTAIKSQEPLLNPLEAKPMGVEVDKGAGLLSGAEGAMDKVGGAAGVIGMATGALDLVSMARGKQYDTSAEGGGVMNAETAITSGAVKGATAGMALGPVGAAVGGLIGAGVGGFSQSAAEKEYNKNRRIYNLANDEVANAESAETYQMEQGKESLGLLKGLRQKQLGIHNS